MSLSAYLDARSYPGLPPNEKLVLLLLADGAGSDDIGPFTGANVTDLVRASGLTEGEVTAALTGLKGRELLVRAIPGDRAADEHAGEAIYRLNLRERPI